MNMFLHELKAYRKTTLLWTISLALLIILFLFMFPTFSSNAEAMKKLLEGYPEALRKALGINLDSFSTLLGFYPFVFGYILLCGAIQAMNLGTSILGKEVREKTADFLLTKPVSRQQILTAKLSAALVSIVFTDVIYLSVASLMATAITKEPFSMNTFLLVSLTLFYLQLIFLSLGILLSVVLPKIKSVLSVSLGTVFGFFIISMMDSSVGEKTVRYLSPFEYFDINYIVKNGAYETSFVILAIVVIGFAITTSYILFGKKDIGA